MKRNLAGVAVVILVFVGALYLKFRHGGDSGAVRTAEKAGAKLPSLAVQHAVTKAERTTAVLYAHPRPSIR